MITPALVQPRSRGFTLIETLLYVVLSSLIIAGVLVSVYPILTGAGRLSERVTVEHEAVFVLRKINWALSQGVITAEVFPPGNVLTLTTASDDIVITENDGAISIDGEPITASRVTISDFLAVYNPKSGSESGFLAISFKADDVLVGPARYNIY